MNEARLGAIPNTELLDDKVYEMFDAAVNQEIKWANHITNGNILGINENSIEGYTKFLANKRLKAIGLKEIYEGYNRSPYQHLNRYADTSKDANKKANFFEDSVTSYIMSSGVSGWNDF